MGRPSPSGAPFFADCEVNAEVLIPILPFPGNFICDKKCAKDAAVAEKLALWYG